MRSTISIITVVFTLTLLGAAAAQAQTGSADRLSLSTQAERAVERSGNARVATGLYRAFVTGSTARIDRVLSRDWADIPINPGQGPGRAGFGPFLAGFRQVFPDLQVRIHEILVVGRKVVVRGTFSGTHSAAFLGVPATGRKVSFRTVDIHEIRGGRIAVTHHLEDLLGLSAQLSG